MRWIAFLFAFIVSATAQTSNGTINPPIYATGYISQVGGTNITTKIAAQPNHPTNLNIYTTSAITGVWTIQLPNPAFEGQVLSFNCGNAAGSFVLGSSCSSIVNFTFNMTAPHDWFCAATNATTGTPLGHSNTGASTTMANIQVNGSNGDLIRFACTPF